MPLSQISLARLDECHPLVKQRALEVSTQFEGFFPGFAIQISQGLRSWNYQTAIYAQGRQPLDYVNSLRATLGLAPLTAAENVEVTRAGPGMSNHNYGYACDWDIQDASGSLDWDASDARWQKLIALAAPNGFRSGACFTQQDRPHMELQEVPEVPTVDMQYTLKNEGVAAVWKAANLEAL